MFLKDEIVSGIRAAHCDVIDQDLALARSYEARHDSQQRALATTARADDGEKLPFLDPKVQAFDHT